MISLRRVVVSVAGSLLMPVLDVVVESKAQRLARAQIVDADQRRRAAARVSKCDS